MFLVFDWLIIFVKEWSDDTYPPWAHGPGYVVSHDIAKTIYRKHKKGHLRVIHTNNEVIH